LPHPPKRRHTDGALHDFAAVYHTVSAIPKAVWAVPCELACDFRTAGPAFADALLPLRCRIRAPILEKLGKNGSSKVKHASNGKR
jgi:hypothetical protein